MNIYPILYIQRTSRRTNPEMLRLKAFSWLPSVELTVFARGLDLDFTQPIVAERLAQFQREHLVVRQGRQFAVHVDQPGNSTNMRVA